VTYLALADGAILGYLTVTPSQIEIDDLPETRAKRLPHYPLPVLRLARLAVDRSVQGRGIGKALFRFALRLASRMSAEFGCVGVVVDAKSGAIDFYRNLGFEQITTLEGVLLEKPEPTPMFLPLSAIHVEKRIGNPTAIRGTVSPLHSAPWVKSGAQLEISPPLPIS
jgi:predicted N-acetyltransferase YhbS